MLTITDHKGFFLKFINGWTISVQFGKGNYCEKRRSEIDDARNSNNWTSENAEVFVGDPQGNCLSFSVDGVLPFASSDQVGTLIGLTQSIPIDKTIHDIDINVWKKQLKSYAKAEHQKHQ